MGPSRRSLKLAEAKLRADDKAIRLRYSLEASDVILVERKTFRGRVGTHAPEGLSWAPDAGYRRENGHVPVASIPASAFDFNTLRDSLRAADTWRSSKTLWQRVEDREAAQRAHQRSNRTLGLRYKASELYDRYAWRQKSRIRVPERIS